jgi:hypothetical protein
MLGYAAILADVVADWCSGAKAGVPAGVAGSLAADRFIGNACRKRGELFASWGWAFVVPH